MVGAQSSLSHLPRKSCRSRRLQASFLGRESSLRRPSTWPPEASPCPTGRRRNPRIRLPFRSGPAARRARLERNDLEIASGGTPPAFLACSVDERVPVALASFYRSMLEAVGARSEKIGDSTGELTALFEPG